MAQNRRIAQRGRYLSPPPKRELQNFDMEVSYGGLWVSLNDKEKYRVAAESLQSTAQTWRKIEVQNPVVEGTYLVHLTPEQCQEQVRVYVYGPNPVVLHERANTLKTLFGQFDYQIRVTMEAHQEYWRCQPADWSMERNHAMVHQGMMVMMMTVPRFPTVEYKALV